MACLMEGLMRMLKRVPLLTRLSWHMTFLSDNSQCSTHAQIYYCFFNLVYTF